MGDEVKKSLAISRIDGPSESLPIYQFLSHYRQRSRVYGGVSVAVCHTSLIHAVLDHDGHACEEALCVCL